MKSLFHYSEARRAIADALKETVVTLFGAEPATIVLEQPPKAELGDFASTLPFDLARSLRRPPRVIAQEIAERFEKPAIVSEVRVEGGGYLNFHLHRPAFTARFLREMGAPAPLEPGTGKVIVEHTSINPNKAAHIGHARNAILGDTLARCLRFSGRTVEVQNYIDDTGVQVADVVVGFLDLDRIGLPEIEEIIARPVRGGASYKCFGDLCWDLYAETGRAYEARPELKGLRSETLHAIEEGNNLRSTVAQKIADAIIAEHVATLGRLGIAYDLLARESDVLRKHFWARALELGKTSGAMVYESEGNHAGCWVMRLGHMEDFAGLDEPDKVLVRSNGTVTYTGKDIAYHLWKIGRLGLDFDYALFTPDWNAGRGGAEAVPEEVRAHPLWQTATGSTAKGPVFGRGTALDNVIDVRQSYPQKVVKESIRALGFEKEAAAFRHFDYEMVALTPATARRLAQADGTVPPMTPEDEGKPFIEISGRKGQGVKAHDLVEALFAEARGELGKREPEAPEDESSRNDRARRIAVGALRYFMLKFGRHKVIAFDFDEALNFEGETGPYLQYSAVRAGNIFRKLEERGISSTVRGEDLERPAPGNPPAIIEDEAWALVVEAARVSEVVDRALATMELSLVARHAYGLAQAFSHFYHRCPIASEPDVTLRTHRLAATRAFAFAMSALFSLLGIPLPEKM